MARSRRFPPYPKRPHSSGQARIKIKGQPVYLGVHGSTASWAEYRRRLDEWHQGTCAPCLPQKPKVRTVNAVLLQYDQHVERYYVQDGKPTRQQGKVRDCLDYVKNRYGTQPAESFDQVALEAVRDDLVADGYHRKTVNAMIGCIRRAWKWLAKRKIVASQCYADLCLLEDLAIGRTPAPEGKKVPPVPEAHVEKTLPFLLPPVAAMVQLQLLAGMRPGEVVIMRAMDLDRSGEIWTYRPGSELPFGRHKNAHRAMHRVVMLGPKCQTIIRAFLKANPTAYLFSPKEALAMKSAAARAKRKSKVQPSQQKRNAARARRRAKRSAVRERYDVMTYGRAVQRACDRAGVPRWHPHQLRHTAATNARRKHGLDFARALLGQKSLEAAEIYAQLDLEKVAEEVKRSG